MEDTAHTVRGSYSEDLDTSFKRQDTSHRRTVFVQMILSFVRVLNTLNHLDTSKERVQLPAQVLDREATILGPWDSISD